VAAFFPDVWVRIAFILPYPLVYCLILAVTFILLLTNLPSLTQRPYLLLSSALLLCLVLLFAWEKVAEVGLPSPGANNQLRWHADDIIVGFQHYSQTLSFYTGQPLYLFQTQGELKFGLKQRPGNPYYLHWPEQLPELLQQHPNFFMIINHELTP
jgi:hypothetical protein